MISIIIPTHNGTHHDTYPQLDKLLARLRTQTVQGEVLLVDSSGKEGIAGVADRFGARVITVKNTEFDHGSTRTLAGRNASGDILVYMTHDAYPSDRYALERLIAPFARDAKIAVSYGRQLPHENANRLAAHLRHFNYPSHSSVRSYEDRKIFGIRTAFVSNGFAAYRRSVMEEIGWFKERLIMSEDMYAGAMVLKRGYRIAYEAAACVHHSHNYSLSEEFKRYFDTGVFHRCEEWIIREFGMAEGEGRRYLRSGITSLAKCGDIALIPSFIIKSAIKYLAYQAGRYYFFIPTALVRKISMHRNWWNHIIRE